ncbi:uncharacterized protein LOC127082544 [Lathyrus oleraceus]|uniref:uncharacterized protein LOC127082544 n=1 Tax=Pisum sativum TaxID=3888 RepID=UPI0021D02AED|nr:uncharacterized protein LOC127082544 [Pisum sativum]
MAQEHGLTELVNQQVGELEPDLFWEKNITRSLKGENQVLLLSYTNYNNKKFDVIRKGLLPDQTQRTLMDLETMDYYDYEIIKSERDNVEMYIGYGWYEYAKEKNLKVGDTLLFIVLTFLAFLLRDISFIFVLFGL